MWNYCLYFFFFSKILLYCGVFLRENGQKIRPISKHLVLLSNVIINSLVFNSSAIWWFPRLRLLPKWQGKCCSISCIYEWVCDARLSVCLFQKLKTALNDTIVCCPSREINLSMLETATCWQFIFTFTFNEYVSGWESCSSKTCPRIFNNYK